MRTGFPNFAQEMIADRDVTAIALRTDRLDISRSDLAERVAARRDDLGIADRSVVVLSGDASIEWVVSYLALLEAGHVPLLAGSHTDRLVAAWNPAAIITASEDGADIEHREDGRWGEATCPDLHPELALLMSTSGSTGDPKLVRLSHTNLSSNASAIAGFLQLQPDDCGITSLPLHYCYGLSVLHSHLVAGASISLTNASVVDPCFRSALERHGVTNIAGVPHTFDLLERTDPDLIRVPSLRFVTQAGGKLSPTSVSRWRDRLGSWGADLVVMYGQTEATARMAYLAPEAALRHPAAIGAPIEGGSFRIDPTDSIDLPTGSIDVMNTDQPSVARVGELVYSGPNVMLGYATTSDDLAEGRTIHELRTGDLARFHADEGVFEIIGRRARFVKPFGLRIDLDGLERDLTASGGPDPVWSDTIAVAGDDEGLVVCAPEEPTPDRLAESIVARTGLPLSSVVVVTSAIPRTRSGKVDYAEVIRCGRSKRVGAAVSHDADSAGVAAVFASVLGRSDVGPTDSFVSLGGDSLSYIECSIRLENLLGRLPADWHLRPIGELIPERRRRFLARVDTTVALRAMAICLVVSTHMGLRFVPGGAHLLLAVVGYNLARFLMPVEPTRARALAGLRTVARVAVPTVIWVAVGLAVGANFGVGTLLLVNNYVGPASHGGDHWHFWFIEVFVHVVIALTVLTAVPAFRRADMRVPYATPLVVLGVLLLLRLDWAQMGDWYNIRYRTHGVAWFVALGWLIQRSNSVGRKALTGAVCLLTVPGFFEYAPREWLIVASLVVLLVAPEIPLPRALVRPLAVLAAASMWIYISHFTYWPPFKSLFDLRVAYVLTIVAGIATWAVAEFVTGRVASAGHSIRRRPLPLAMFRSNGRWLGSPNT